MTERAKSLLNRYSAPTTFSALLVLVFTSISLANPARPSLDDLEDTKQLETKADATLESLDDAFNESAAAFVKKCMLAFGHKEFCDCVSLRVKKGISFESYVRFSTRSKAQLNFASSSARLRAAIDSAHNSSTACRKTHFGSATVAP